MGSEDLAEVLRAAGVTQRESQILRAVADLLTNAEIAAQLSISVRTVESHVSALIAKLGVRDRRALGALARTDLPTHRRPVTLPEPLCRSAAPAWFVGREEELARVRREWERTVAGRRQLCLIAGEAGIGKTRLVAEFALQAHRDGAAVLYGRCDEDLDIPYDGFAGALSGWLRESLSPGSLSGLGPLAGELAVLLPWLPGVVPGLAEPPPDEAKVRRHRLFEAVREVLDLAAAAAPVLLILDDLHWAGPPTLALLRHVLRSDGPGRFLVLATLRDNEPGPFLPSALADLCRDLRVARVPLRRLDDAALAALIRLTPDLPGTSDRERCTAVVQAQSGGNPFFAVEILRHLGENDSLEVPDGVREVVGRRVSRLSPDAGHALRVAAVVGSDVALPVLARVSGLSDADVIDAIDEAISARLVVESRAAEPETKSESIRYGFAHAIVRDTLLAQLSDIRRRHVHALAAAAIESAHADDLPAHASEIAYHLTAAGPEVDPGRTRSFRVLAGEHAMASVAFEDAVAHFAAAAALDGGTPASDRGRLRLQLATALSNSGHWNDAFHTLRSSLEIAEEAGDTATLAQACQAAAYNAGNAGRLIDARSLIARGLEALPGRNRERALVLGMAGATSGYLSAYEEGRAQLAEALDIARELDDAPLLGHCLHMQAIRLSGHWEDGPAVEPGLAAVDTFRRLGLDWQRAAALGFCSIALLGCGRLAESRTLWEELDPLARRVGNYPARMHAGRIEGMLRYLDSGSPDDLEDLGRCDLEFCQGFGMGWTEHSYHWLAQARFLRGEIAEALALCDTGESVERPPPSSYSGWAWASRFEYLAYSGDRDAVLALLDGGRGRLPVTGRPNPWAAWVVLQAVVEGLAVLGVPDAAGDLYPLTVECMARTGVVLSEYRDGRLLERVAGVAATNAQAWDAATAHFEAALRQAETLPNRPEKPHIQRFWGRMLLDRGRPADRSRAVEMLGEALAAYEAMRMPLHARLIRTYLSEAAAGVG